MKNTQTKLKLGKLFDNAPTLREVLAQQKEKQMTELYSFKILDNGIIVNGDGQETNNVNANDFDTVTQSDGSVALIEKLKNQIVNNFAGE